ncbi:MAG: AraC family transcriptional regulator [Pseudomonadota bacterium]
MQSGRQETTEQERDAVADLIATRWRRVIVQIADTSTQDGAAALEDFHVFELCLDNRPQSDPERVRRTIQIDTVTPVPGMLNLREGGTVRRDSPAQRYRVQQILIADSVFAEAAAAIAPEGTEPLKPLGFEGLFDPGLKALADALLEEARMPTLGGELYADMLAQQIAIRVLRRRYQGPIEARLSGYVLSDGDLARVLAHLDRDLSMPGGVDALADALGMETMYFSRAFKETTGQTPYQYLLDRRIMRAKDLLLSSDLSLAEIADETGFSSQSHMTSTFKKRIGLSPGRWRTQTVRG